MAEPICDKQTDKQTDRKTNRITDNTSHIIKRTGKMIRFDRNNAFSGLKFGSDMPLTYR